MHNWKVMSYNVTFMMKWNCVIVKFVSNILKLQQISAMQSLNAFTSDLMRSHPTAYDGTSWFEGLSRTLESLKTFDKNKRALWISAQLIVFVHLLVKGLRDKNLIRPGNWKHTNDVIKWNHLFNLPNGWKGRFHGMGWNFIIIWRVTINYQQIKYFSKQKNFCLTMWHIYIKRM